MSCWREDPAVLIAALSGRALAAAARRSGYAPLVADLFGDLDTRAIAANSIQVRGSLSRGLRGASLLQALDRLADGRAVEGIAYASGFEDRPNLVAAMARGRTLLGNTPDTIARVKAPADFAALCRTLGIPHPEIAWKEPRETGWLWKRRGGSGGVHVQTRKPVLAERGGWYLQKRAEGRPVSALFLADGHRSLVLGFSEQWPDPTPAHPFRYGGAVRPATLSPGWSREMADAVARIVPETRLVGLNSADFLVRAEGFDLLEINPRPGATLDLFRHPDLFRLHVEACRGELAACPPVFERAAAAAVVYAPAALRLRPGFFWPDWASDRQPPGQPVARDAPLCTVIAEADNADQARAQLRSRAAEILARVGI